MSISDIYSSGFKKRNRGHFAAIVRIALSDGFISSEEKQILKRLAVNLEIEKDEFKYILNNADQYPINPPSSQERRIERLYDLSVMIYADNIVFEEERLLLKKLIIGIGFKFEDADSIVEKALTLISNKASQSEFMDAFE